MKNITKTLFFLLITLSFVACSDFTDGINEDPNTFTSAPGSMLIGQANMEVVKLFSSQAGRTSSIFTDQLSGIDRQYSSLNIYVTTAGDYDDDWQDLYASGFAQAKLAEADAIKDGNKVLEGVAQIVQGMLVAEAASLWGDVPFVEAGDYVKFQNPKYDGQKSVLDAAQSLFSKGITNVGAATVSASFGAPVYKTNSATWAKVGNSLKARYYLVAKDYPNALTYAKLGISNRNEDLLSNHTSTVGQKNMYFQFLAELRSGMLSGIDSNLFKLVTGVKPRLLATPGDIQRAAFYFTGTNPRTSSGGIFAVDASFPIISFVETKLIEAEAAHRTSGDALTPFNAVRTELASVYGGSFPASTDSGNTLLLQILEEKYISLLGQTQVFHDVRRTNNAIGVPIKGVGATKIPQRFLYPQTEINSNKNFPGLVDLYTATPVNN
ncbi:MAG: SusD/RagB family nutrient-binding outer membrane lipoprotein [Flavobacteriaceae bacterium]|nr:SusD/RagB family nutrient-binding outer membrane lipoprotein [Flavobacteriaceae bacterium]